VSSMSYLHGPVSGIDHCSAIKLLEELRAEGKAINSFISFCGGLPAPEDSNVRLNTSILRLWKIHP
jgi:hypothetical protein